MRTGSPTQIARLSPIRRALLDAQTPEPLKRREWTTIQQNAGYVKWLEYKFPYAQIASALGVKYSFVHNVACLMAHRRVPAIQPPQDVMAKLLEAA